jgi:hypothetical protein
VIFVALSILILKVAVRPGPNEMPRRQSAFRNSSR